MQWGEANIDTFAATVLAQNAKRVLTFNEPDLPNQSNLDAAYAAKLWLQYIQPLSMAGVLLGAPAVSSAATGRPWLSSFLAACTGCTIDFVPLHWYGTGVGNFYDYIWSMHGEFPYPIWVTEYADNSASDSDVASFLDQSMQYLDSDTMDWVERYAWFAFFRSGDQNDGSLQSNLLDLNGNLNAMGTAYIVG